MSLRILVEFTNLFFAGILAGLEIAAHYGFHGPTLALDERPQIWLRQHVIRRLRWLVPAFFVPMALSGALVTVLDGDEAGVLLRAVATIAVAVWIVVRVVGTVRINSATLEWDPDAPPKQWRSLIATAERFHAVGAWAATLAFICFLAAVALRLAQS